MFFDTKSGTPLYKQIVTKIEEDIENGLLNMGDSLLSINEFSEEHEIARDTVEKAYKLLKNRGIIGAVKGKGYFITSPNVHAAFRIFLHFNKLSAHKKTIYNAFIKEVGQKGTIDLAIHHNNVDLFQTQLTEALGNYTHYAIIPPDNDTSGHVARLLKKVPSTKLLLLDKLNEHFAATAAVFQHFENDIQGALIQALQALKRYRKISLVFPKERGYANEVMVGFTAFCTAYGFEFDIISTIDENKVNKGKVFIIIEDDDLVRLIKLIKNKNLVLGQEIGIISYNDSPLKEILADGITVISTDFNAMGHIAAQLLLEGKKELVANQFRLIMRKSL